MKFNSEQVEQNNNDKRVRDEYYNLHNERKAQEKVNIVE